MLLGFKRRFVPLVEEGSKTHTIRSKRKRAPRAGEICHCYVDPRQKTMRLLGRWPCILVEDISIEADGTVAGVMVVVNGSVLDEDERNLLAWRDGFRPTGSSERDPGQAFTAMLEFWRRRLPFYGDIIHWDYSRPQDR
jgi:hypothetical protein